jgi:hypothetical protein
MNTYEITWQETTLRRVIVEGASRQEAWELFGESKGKPVRSKKIMVGVPAIQLITPESK